MNDLTAIIANNLAEIRHQRKLSLDKLSELSGVSKALLGQIERSESNPTVNTLWKIASGLQIPFNRLIAGILEITLGDQIYELNPGDAIRFQSDQPHSYRNVTNSVVKFQNYYQLSNGGQIFHTK